MQLTVQYLFSRFLILCRNLKLGLTHLPLADMFFAGTSYIRVVLHQVNMVIYNNQPTGNNLFIYTIILHYNTENC